MKKFVTTILCFAALTSFSQSSLKKQSKLKIGFTFSTDMNLTSSSISDSRWSHYEMEPSEFNYTTGIIGLLSIKPSVAIGSGITYSNKDYSVSYYCDVCDYGFDTRSLQTQQRFIEIPIFVRYQFINGKFGLHGETGFTGSYLFKEIENKYGLVPNCNNFLLSGQLGLGIDIALGQKIDFSLTTRYTRSLSDFYEYSDFRFNTLEFITSLMYRIENK